MKRLTLLLFPLCIFFHSNAQNLVIIPDDAATLSEAVGLAQSGDTIVLSAGLYTDSVHISSKTLIFRGDPNGGSVLSPGDNEKSFVLEDSDIQFSYLEFDDFEQNSPPPNFAISADYSNVKIDHCRFNHLYSPITLFWGNLEISNSIFSDTRGNSSILHNGGAFLIYNNSIYGIDGTAISINRARGQFFNNTMVGSTPTEHFGLIINSDSISHIYNNIIDGFGIGIQLTASDSMELEALRIYNNNIYNAAAPYWYEYNEDLSFPISSGALIPNPGTGEISASSDFVDPANDDYRLLLNSPCIDAGIDAYPFLIGFDLEGNGRILGSDPDIGAYEFSGLSGLKDLGVGGPNSNLEVYPQPTNNSVWISFNDRYSGAIEVLDVTGNVLRRTEIKGVEKVEVDLPEYSGTFILRMVGNDGIMVRRVLKVI